MTTNGLAAYDGIRSVTTRSDEGVHVNCFECDVKSPAFRNSSDVYNNSGLKGWSRLRKNGRNVFRCPDCRKKNGYKRQ